MRVFASICFLFCATLLAQEEGYWIQFTDKNNTPFSVSQPEQFLSERAIQRRIKFNISVTEEDLPVDPAYIQAVLSGANCRLHHTSRWFNAITVFTEDSLYMQQVASWSFVLQVQKTKPDDGRSMSSESKFATVSLCNCPYSPAEISGAAYEQNKMVGVDKLHLKGFTGMGVHIAVLDSGFDLVDQNEFFTRLFENNQILGTHDFVDGDSHVYGHHFHGTAVLSVMAAYKAREFVGTAPDAAYYLLRTEDVASEYLIEEDNWVAAAEYADSAGVDIINTSLGYTRFDDSTQNHTYADLDGGTTRIAIASNIASSKGILLITGAGNYGATTWHYISTPADAKNILTVGAVDSDRNYAAFSSHGPSADGRIKPDVVAQGFQAKLVFPYVEEIFSGNGTSFSAPIMAGAMACFWQALPQLDNKQLIQLARQYAHLYPGYNYELGFGVSNLYDAYVAESGDISDIAFGVYPNPVYDRLHIETKGFSPNVKRTISITFLDLLGREVKACTYEITGNEIITLTNEVNCLPSGIYLLKIQEGKTIQCNKIIRVDTN
ncbi:MAG: S8 family serine peptidase [Flavobacteriales bacterium]